MLFLPPEASCDLALPELRGDKVPETAFLDLLANQSGWLEDTTMMTLVVGFLAFSVIAALFFMMGLASGSAKPIPAEPKSDFEIALKGLPPCERDGHHIISMSDLDPDEKQLPAAVRHYCSKCGLTLDDIAKQGKGRLR